MDFKILYYGTNQCEGKGIYPTTEIISEDAFNGRKAYKVAIRIPSTVKEIGKNAFKDYYDLEQHHTYNFEIQFGNSSRLWTLDNGTVVPVNNKELNATNLCTTYVNNTWKIADASSGLVYTAHTESGTPDFCYVKNDVIEPCQDTNIFIPDYASVGVIKSLPIKVILDDGFKGLQMETISLPTKLTGIYNNAFEGCSKLKFIVIPKTCTRIDAQVFKDCTDLTAIYFEDTNTRWNVISDPITREKIKSDVYVGKEGENATMFKTTYVNYYWEKQ